MMPERFEPVLREVRPLVDRFSAAGERLFLVGGTVRDLMSGDQRPDFDIDATTPARPDRIKQLLNGWADAVWTQGERFGTIGAKRFGRGGPGDDLVVEVTTYRTDEYDPTSRKPVVATDFPHARELLRTGAGVVVPHGDPVAIADAIGRILRDHRLARQMADEAGRVSAPMMWDAVARSYLDLVLELIGTRGLVGERRLVRAGGARPGGLGEHVA